MLNNQPPYEKYTPLIANYIEQQDVELTRRLFVFFVTSYLGSAILFFFAYKYFNTPFVGMKVLYSVGALLTFGNVILAHLFTHKVPFIMFTGVLVGCLMLGQVFTGGYLNTGLYWIFPFAFAMFILLGYRWGMVGSIVVFIFTALLLLNPQYTIAKYTFVESTRFMASLAAINILLFASEFTRYKSHQTMVLLHSEKEWEANTDALTNLVNRRFVTGVFLEQLNNNKEHLLPLSIIMVDIDHFKAVNDNYGHDAGDKVLVQFANILQKNVRASDLVARMGGEEFLIMFPNTNIHQAKAMANAIREKVEQTPFILSEEVSISLSASFGVSTAEQAEDAEAAVSKADANLYIAKRGGRNRVID